MAVVLTSVSWRHLAAAPGCAVGAAATRRVDLPADGRGGADVGRRDHHDIRVEPAIASVGPITPHLIDGKRACPPEDRGDTSGSEHLLDVLADPTHDEHDELMWVGGEYDADAFDLAEVLRAGGATRYRC